MAAQVDEPAEANVAEQAPDDTDGDGWPSLSELDLDVCVMKSALPGVEVPTDDRQRNP